MRQISPIHFYLKSKEQKSKKMNMISKADVICKSDIFKCNIFPENNYLFTSLMYWIALKVIYEPTTVNIVSYK